MLLISNQFKKIRDRYNNNDNKNKWIEIISFNTAI